MRQDDQTAKLHARGDGVVLCDVLSRDSGSILIGLLSVLWSYKWFLVTAAVVSSIGGIWLNSSAVPQTKYVTTALVNPGRIIIDDKPANLYAASDLARTLGEGAFVNDAITDQGGREHEASCKALLPSPSGNSVMIQCTASDREIGARIVRQVLDSISDHYSALALPKREYYKRLAAMEEAVVKSGQDRLKSVEQDLEATVRERQQAIRQADAIQRLDQGMGHPGKDTGLALLYLGRVQQAADRVVVLSRVVSDFRQEREHLRREIDKASADMALYNEWASSVSPLSVVQKPLTERQEVLPRKPHIAIYSIGGLAVSVLLALACHGMRRMRIGRRCAS